MKREGFPVGAAITAELLSTDPHPALARLREREPVSWIPDFAGWIVTRRDLCVAVMRDAETFTVDDPRFSTAQVIGPSMLSLDGQAHERHRVPFVDPFRSAEVRDRFVGWTRQRARELVQEVAHFGGADLRASVAAPLAVQVMSRALDLQGVGERRLLAWYEAIVAAVDEVTRGGEVPDAGRRAFANLRAAVASNLETSRLLRSVVARGTLTTDEIVSNVAVLLFGGIVTAESTTAAVLRFLFDHPSTLAEIRADRSLVPTAVEEALRMEPAAAAVDRYATRDIELGGASIRTGDLVRVSLAGANRDPDVFAEPDRFDLHRSNAKQHLTFAVGPHACLGIHLARLETAAALEAVLDLLPSAEADPARYGRMEGLIFRAPQTVWARWGVG